MASVACWYAASVRPPMRHPHWKVVPNSSSSSSKGLPSPIQSTLRIAIAIPKLPSPVLCCNNNELQQQQKECGAKRRQILLGLTFAAHSLPAIVSDASAFADINTNTDVEEGFRVYTDDVNKFKILIPQEWQVGAGEPNGFKSVTAFYPIEEVSSCNVSVVITGLGPDFTKMESFGKVDEFAETLVGGLDRSWQRPPGVSAKLKDCKASKGFYYINYSLQKPGESCRYLYSALGMSSNGYYNKLYTVTGQFVEEESEKYSSKIYKAVASFRNGFMYEALSIAKCNVHCSLPYGIGD
ncbi:hypothetical protein FNV43_RR12114 [Rhamnella rubrinervis]|uniref:PsbP C-terminal domain-containing protein n=1 Tax=Rhamnella rubrinervis TaxID=2594499 RepID=A0A8K0H7A2_9ROSA|nr:hypothetical protein FNV43_RR12114 [Rhamnella rubrinervis]